MTDSKTTQDEKKKPDESQKNNQDEVKKLSDQNKALGQKLKDLEKVNKELSTKAKELDGVDIDSITALNNVVVEMGGISKLMDVIANKPDDSQGHDKEAAARIKQLKSQFDDQIMVREQRNKQLEEEIKSLKKKSDENAKKSLLKDALREGGIVDQAQASLALGVMAEKFDYNEDTRKLEANYPAALNNMGESATAVDYVKETLSRTHPFLFPSSLGGGATGNTSKTESQLLNPFEGGDIDLSKYSKLQKDDPDRLKMLEKAFFEG